jgi:hypothetical protein
MRAERGSRAAKSSVSRWRRESGRGTRDLTHPPRTELVPAFAFPREQLFLGAQLVRIRWCDSVGRRVVGGGGPKCQLGEANALVVRPRGAIRSTAAVGVQVIQTERGSETALVVFAPRRAFAEARTRRLVRFQLRAATGTVGPRETALARQGRGYVRAIHTVAAVISAGRAVVAFCERRRAHAGHATLSGTLETIDAGSTLSLLPGTGTGFAGAVDPVHGITSGRRACVRHTKSDA